MSIINYVIIIIDINIIFFIFLSTLNKVEEFQILEPLNKMPSTPFSLLMCSAFNK